MSLSEIADRVVRALKTAYVDKGIAEQTNLSDKALAKGDERDFLEILGNLIENAFKYTNSQIVIHAYNKKINGQVCGCVEIVDNGPGIPKELRDVVLNRGLRLDEIENGQGIGLAMVAELIGLYQGKLVIEDAALGENRQGFVP